MFYLLPILVPLIALELIAERHWATLVYLIVVIAPSPFVIS